LSGPACSAPTESPPNLCSQYKNRVHHYTHQTSSDCPGTFCGGFGAIRRDVFLALKGFDCRQMHLEDIELGYRLSAAGHRVHQLRALQMTHLKRYTFASLLRPPYRTAPPWPLSPSLSC